MKIVKIVIILVSLSISSLIFADVPYVFSAGTSAKASEVNENFNALESDIKSASARILTLESAPEYVDTSCDNSISWWANKHETSYQEKSSAIGRSLTYNDVSYRIVEVHFREFGAGDLYTLRFPAAELSPGQVYANISTSHASSQSDCSNSTISGYPAFNFGTQETRSMILSNNGSSESYSKVSAYNSVSIKVNETNIFFSLTASKTETSSVVFSGDFDFTDDIDVNKMTHDQDLINVVDDLLDYIKITKAQ